MGIKEINNRLNEPVKPSIFDKLFGHREEDKLMLVGAVLIAIGSCLFFG